MPRLIPLEDQRLATPEECIDALDAIGFDPRDETALLEAALWLRRLGNNRTFLADVLVAELQGCARSAQEDSAYSPQSLMLSGYRPGYFLRANIWPGERDAVFRASGGGTFAYGFVHDHNFDFLTLGYHGPGYASDYWEYDCAAVTGRVGEPVALRYTGRRTLDLGTILHYRAHRDVHAQHPPESLSVSLNIMATNPAQGWLDQYRFDPQRGTIAGFLSANSTETFLRVALACGSPEAEDLAAHFGRVHPSDRLRLAAFEARAEQARGPAAREAIWREGERSGSRLVRAVAGERLRAMARVLT